MDPASAMIGAGGGLLSGVMNFIGQRESNQANQRLAENNNEFNAAEAKKNRDWQAEMSNSAKQREVEDLKKAGLNRLLAANGGASTPGGGAASGSPATMQNELEGAITSAREAAALRMAADKQTEEIGNLRESRKLMEAQAQKARVETQTLRGDAARSGIMEGIYNKLSNAFSSTTKSFADKREGSFNDMWDKIEKKKAVELKTSEENNKKYRQEHGIIKNKNY